MPLNVPSRKAESLASEVASEAGETVTEAVVRALEERLTRLREQNDASTVTPEAIMEISRRCSALPDCDQRGPDDILGYDERGVPA